MVRVKKERYIYKESMRGLVVWGGVGVCSWGEGEEWWGGIRGLGERKRGGVKGRWRSIHERKRGVALSDYG